MRKNKFSSPTHNALFPSAGDGGKDVFLPYNLNATLDEIAVVFKSLKIKRAFHIAPPFWQIESIYHRTCRKMKIPDCMGTIYNLPLADKLIRELKMEAIVTIEKIFWPLMRFLNKPGAEPPPLKLWYFFGDPLSGRLADVIKRVWPDAKIYQHYAPFPPVPIGYQCQHLSGRINHFHQSLRPDTKVELSLTYKILVSIKKPLLKPLIKFETAHRGKLYEKKCPCGQKRIFEARV